MTINKAIRRGQILVNGPVLVIIICVSGAIIYLSTSSIIPNFFAPLSIMIGPGIAWIYWSFAITKWRIWALTHVEDQTELKMSAIEVGLIWPDGSIFERTEFRTLKESKIIHELEKRYKSQRAKTKFKDDLTIPEETQIGYSKTTLIASIIIFSLVTGIGIYIGLVVQSLIPGVFLTVLGILLSYKEFKKLSKTTPPLVISNKGIEFERGKYSWKEISGENALIEGYGKNRSSFLIFNVGATRHRISVDDYNISLAELRNKLRIHRGRYNKN